MQAIVAKLSRNAIAHADQFAVAIDSEYVGFDAEFVVAIVVQRKRQICLAAAHVDYAQALAFAQPRFTHQIVENLDDALQLPVFVAFAALYFAFGTDNAEFAQIGGIGGFEHVASCAIVFRRWTIGKGWRAAKQPRLSLLVGAQFDIGIGRKQMRIVELLGQQRADRLRRICDRMVLRNVAGDVSQQNADMRCVLDLNESHEGLSGA